MGAIPDSGHNLDSHMQSMEDYDPEWVPVHDVSGFLGGDSLGGLWGFSTEDSEADEDNKA